MTFETPLTRQANILHLLPLATIRRDRLLPIPGKVIARKGQRVNATDVVAEGDLATKHLLMDLARGLGLPANRTDSFLQVKVGDRLEAGDLIAGPVGRAHRVVRAPQKSRVIVVGAGWVLLEENSRAYSLKAGLPGLVTGLIANRGVNIETTGALLQGVWGNGMLDFASLRVLAGPSDEPLSPQQIGEDLRGAVVLGGRVETAATLKRAAELPIGGMILGSLAPALLQEADRVPFPVVLLEGFTRQPINAAAYDLLVSNDGREVVVNAERWDPYTGVRPEIIIPLPADAPPAPVEALLYEVGQVVRVARPPAAGQLGVLERLAGFSLFPGGVRALAGEVRFQNGGTAVIPLANLEVLG